MFHIVNIVEGVYEVWYARDEHDYEWDFIGDFDSREEAQDEVALMEMLYTL